MDSRRQLMGCIGGQAAWLSDERQPFSGFRQPLCAPILSGVSRFVEDVRRAQRQGRLGTRFRSSDLRRACPGWAPHTYEVFLPKHRRGNPGGYTAYFARNRDGTYSLLPD